MIITGSKVNLSSSRSYERKVTHSSQTVSWGGNHAGIIARHSFTSSYSTRQQFYASARNDLYTDRSLNASPGQAIPAETLSNGLIRTTWSIIPAQFRLSGRK